MRRPRASSPALQRKVDRFNSAHAVGTAVTYRSHPTADPFETRTRSAAWVLSGHTAVVMVEGVAGGVALDAVTLTKQPAGAT